MNPPVTSLKEHCEMSQSEIGEKLFLRQQTIAKIEKVAMENFKLALAERNIDIKDLL